MGLEKISIKRRILVGVILGLFFGTAMAAYDYYEDTPFSLGKFLFHSGFFGLFMALSNTYKYKKDNNKRYEQSTNSSK